MESQRSTTGEDLTPGVLAENLRDANSRLCSWLDRLAVGSATRGSAELEGTASRTPHDAACGQSEPSISVHPSVSDICPPAPEPIAGLLSELTRAGAWLRQLPRGNDLNDPASGSKNDPKANPELEHELARYRQNVERVRALLPAIHRALVEERARLERERARVHSAAAWARGSRQTL